MHSKMLNVQFTGSSHPTTVNAYQFTSDKRQERPNLQRSKLNERGRTADHLALESLHQQNWTNDT